HWPDARSVVRVVGAIPLEVARDVPVLGLQALDPPDGGRPRQPLLLASLGCLGPPSGLSRRLRLPPRVVEPPVDAVKVTAMAALRVVADPDRLTHRYEVAH